MAITATVKITETASGADLTTFTTATSYSPTVSRIQVVYVSVHGGTIGLTHAPVLTGCGLTWHLGAAQSQGTPNASSYLLLFYSAGAAPVNGALTYTAFAGDNFNAAVIAAIEFGGTVVTGIDGVGAFGDGGAQGGLDNAAAFGITLGAVNDGANALLAAFTMWDGNNNPTPRALWTELTSTGVPGQLHQQVQFYAALDSGASVVWDNNGPQGGVAVELVAAAGGGTGPIDPNFPAWNRRRKTATNTLARMKYRRSEQSDLLIPDRGRSLWLPKEYQRAA